MGAIALTFINFYVIFCPLLSLLERETGFVMAKPDSALQKTRTSSLPARHAFERVMGIGPTISSLARKRCTTQLHPQVIAVGARKRSTN